MAIEEKEKGEDEMMGESFKKTGTEQRGFDAGVRYSIRLRLDPIGQ